MLLNKKAPKCLITLEAFFVRPARLERATYGLEVRCSIRLSYGRNLKNRLI